MSGLGALDSYDRQSAKSKYGPRNGGLIGKRLLTENVLQIYTAVIATAFFIFFLLFIYGAHQSGETMKFMKKGMEQMNNKTEEIPRQIVRYVQDLTSDYPKDYDKVLVNEFTGIITDVRRISSRGVSLLEGITPSVVMGLATKAEAIVSGVNQIMANVDKDQTADLVNRISSLIATVDDHVSSLDPKMIQDAVKNFNKIAEHFVSISENIANGDLITKITTLVELTNALEKRVNEVHEIKFQLP